MMLSFVQNLVYSSSVAESDTGLVESTTDQEYVFTLKNQAAVQDKLDEGVVRVSKLLIHPIKSCRGTSVASARYTPIGLENDRRWCILDAKNHGIMTARAIPKMVLITPRIIEDPSDPSGGRLEVSFPPGSGCETFSIPLSPTPEILQNWDIIDDCTVHSFKEIDGYITQPCQPSGDPTLCSTVLSRYMGREVHLLYKGPRPRPAPPTVAFPDLEATVDYHDGYPLLVASEESFMGVKALAKAWCKEQTKEELIHWDVDSLVIERYRPNIVFKGSGVPFAEDFWRHIRISPTASEDSENGAAFSLVSKCTRCMLPNIDPASGVRNMAIPSKPMLQFRKGLAPPNTSNSCFGCNAVPAGSGVISVGDIVSVEDWEDV